MTNDGVPLRAAIYVRISQDRTGEELGVDRQREQCEKLATSRGWTVVKVYVENDTSAKGHKARPQWEAMMAEVEAGRIDVVIGWTIDRTLRSGKDRLRMLESGKAHNLVISLVRGNDMDLSTPSGRLAADILGAVALAEIEMKSDRQKAAHAQAAKQGRRIGGRRPFGFEQDGMTIRPAEADAVVAAFNDYLAGTAILAIAKQWNAAGLLSGVPSKTGEPATWGHGGVRQVLRNARYIGVRTHNGEEVGPAAWPALVPESTFRAVNALLDSSASATKPRGGRRLLTGIAKCGGGKLDDNEPCGLTVHVGGTKAHLPPVYRCPTGKHVSRRASFIEEDVTDVLVALLSDPRRAALFVQAESGDNSAHLQKQAADLRNEMDAIAMERVQRKITPHQFTLMNDDLMAQLAEIEIEMTSSTRSTTISQLVRGGFTRAKWDDLDIGKQRTVVDAVLDITIYSAGKGYGRPDIKHVVMTPKMAVSEPKLRIVS